MYITESMYRYAQQRIEELIPQTPDDMPMDHPLMLELNIVSAIVEEYENEHFPIGKPTLGQIIADAMSEAGVTGKQLAERLGVSPHDPFFSFCKSNRFIPNSKIFTCFIL